MTSENDHFQDFLLHVKAPALRDIALYWHEARQKKWMPAWRDIDPTRIAPHLSIVWSWRYDRESERFTGRLIGQTITDLFGRSIRGVKMDDYFQDDAYEAVYERCRRIGAPRILSAIIRNTTGRRAPSKRLFSSAAPR